MRKITSKNKEETIKLGYNLAKKCQGGEIFALIGDLGSGKTTLTKGLAQGLGIKENVNSPTFVIANTYPLKNKGLIKNLIHIDAYRLKNKRDLENIAFFDIISDPENIVAIEWANKIKKYLPPKSILIKLKTLKEDQKEISFPF